MKLLPLQTVPSLRSRRTDQIQISRSTPTVNVQHALVTDAAQLEQNAMENSPVIGASVSDFNFIRGCFAKQVDLLIPCEYNRQIKKRGKGSELYPQNPRKVERKTPLYSSGSRLPGTSVINLPGEEESNQNTTEKTSWKAPSSSEDNEAKDKSKTSTSTEEAELKAKIKKLQDYSSKSHPYSALMGLAATSEQHHQLSEVHKSSTNLKRHHPDDSLNSGYPRKSISIPSLAQEKGLQTPPRWPYSEDSQYPLSNLPSINDLKMAAKEVSTDLETSTPLSHSPPNLPSISSTPMLVDSPVDSSMINNPEIPNSGTRLPQPKISTPNTDTHWHLKSPFSASDIINSMFDRANIPGGNTPQIGNSTGASAANSKRNSVQELWSNTEKTKTYPVLDPIVNEIDFMPLQLVSEFLEIYFTNHIYAVAPILRRSSLLSFTKPRKCSPVLLYSILYVSAHVCNHPLITSAPDFKAGLTSKLLDRLMSYMRPWRNDNSHEYDLDEIIAYINVGVVSSASEFKGSSMRWWAIAWCMARVLKLNKEIPAMEEETREERRRAWWTLFMIDRHLSLCYNRPCTLLDSESLELFFPIAEDIWESDRPLYPPEEDRNRRRGPQCTAIEVGLFGMYLPLMTLLGGIIDMHFLGMSPVLSGKEHVLKLLRESYRHRLNTFQFSLDEYYSHISSPSVLLKAWKEYCQCFIQVFHILLEGFWDPTDMLDDIDVLLNDSRFTQCQANSIQASKHVERILSLDSDLQVIPFFFGVQLLQAGFIPFCMSERYGSHTSTDVAQACETFVRAHEVCILTLNTQYQVNFRFIMRGVIKDLKSGAVSVNDRIDSTRRRRQIMSMYRWNAGGTGLAV